MIEIGFDQIAYERTERDTSRPTIVFLHDSLGCIQLWRDFPEKLGALTQCNTLVYDRQGYGKSRGFSYQKRDDYYMEHEADLLHQYLTQWNIKNTILFGHSDGGSIALIAAGKYPEGIAGIITEGAHIFVEDLTLQSVKTAKNLYYRTELKAKLEKYHGDKTEAMFQAWANTWTTEAFRSWNIEQFLAGITCPSLIIQGEKDEYGTLKQVEHIVEQTQGISSPLILPRVRHSPHKEVPEVVLEQTAAFIQEIVD